MADIKKIYGVDKKKEQEGVWKDMGDGLSMRIARMNNPNYKKRFQVLTKPHQRALRKDRLSEDIAEGIMVRCLAETIVLDWKGVEEDGKETPYSVDNAIRILTEYSELREYVQEIANVMEGYKEDDDEEAVENLKK